MPQLQQGFDVFANWQTVLFCLSIYIATFAVRSFVETLAVEYAKKKTWTDLILPMMPIFFGIVFALGARKFPWPVPVSNAHSAKIMYGAVCGLFNGWMYSRVRAWFNIAADNGNEFAAKVLKRPPTIPPPPMPEPDPAAAVAVTPPTPATVVTTTTTVAHEGPITAEQGDDETKQT
jgi:hypothetical protein